MPYREYVQAGTLVLRQGMLGNHAYKIESGKIEITIRDGDGDEFSLAILGPGSYIGEMAVLFGGHRCASARALEDSVLIPIGAHEIEESSKGADGLYHHLMRLSVDRMNDTHRKLTKWREEKSTSQRA